MGSLVAEATEAESQLTESGSSNNELSPTSELATGAGEWSLQCGSSGAPQLEELEGEPGAQPADTSEDTFEPSGGVAKLETEQEASGATSDSAVESESESEAVESGSLVAEATEAESQLTESGSSNNELSPTSELATGALPELAMLEPGAPQLEELEGEPGAQPADTSEDTFEPSGGVAKLETEQEASGATSESVESESESEAVESGSLVAEATEAESQLTESGSSNNELSPTSELATGALPELAMLEPGAPQLEELEGEPGAQPADTSEDTFEPSGGVAKLETEQEASGATSDSAVESESESEAVESGSLVAEATEAESQLTESGSSNNELSPTSELATERCRSLQCWSLERHS